MASIIHSYTGEATPFDKPRLHASIITACHSVRLAEGVAHDTAARICLAIEEWLTDKSEVTSSDIRRKTSEVLAIICPEAGYLYQHQHTIL